MPEKGEVKLEECWTKEDFDDAHEREHVEVPLVRATKESLEGYGVIVDDFEKETIKIEPWPATGTRPVMPGTGQRGGVAEGDFECFWDGNYCKAINYAEGWDIITGRLDASSTPSDRNYILVREANYHPDGEQCFFPKDGKDFIILLAKPGDDIKLEDFKAFYCDGKTGVKIFCNIWHQPVYPVDDKGIFNNKQGAVHACILIDSVKEFGKYLKMPLKEEFVKG